MRALLLGSILGLVLCTPRASEAQLNLRNSEVLRGAYRTIGNLLIDCPGAGSGTCDNNTAIMVPVDVDQDPNTAMSSSANLVLPPAATVRSATLYLTSQAYIDVPGSPGPVWIPSDPLDFPVKFAPPGGGYTTVVPDEVQPVLVFVGFLARYDVTSLVTAGGTYFVADALLAPASHPYNRVLSWTLLVTYEDGSPPYLVTTYDGVLNCSNNTTTLNLAGFRTPAGAAPNALFSAWSIDGHPTITGESIRLGTTQLSNASNPSNNIGNSSVSDTSGPITRSPSTFRVTEEMDLDTFAAGAAFSPGQTNVDVTFTCGNQEGVVYHLAVIGLDIVAPELSAAKEVRDDNGGEVVAGDELVYTLRASNGGGDDAVQVVLRDPLPPGLSYVPGSITYGETTPVPKTDAPGDDEAEWTGDTLVFRLGAGANGTSGGTLAIGLTEVVQFRARVETATSARALINRAYLSAQGAQGGSGATRIEVASSTAGVVALPCSGFANGQCPDAGVIEDAAVLDATPEDTGVETDAAAFDLGPGDSGPLADAAPSDTGQKDAAPADTGARDLGVADGGINLDATVAVDTGAPEASDEGCDCQSTRTARHGSTTRWLYGLLLAVGGWIRPARVRSKGSARRA